MTIPSAAIEIPTVCAVESPEFCLARLEPEAVVDAVEVAAVALEWAYVEVVKGVSLAVILETEVDVMVDVMVDEVPYDSTVCVAATAGP